MTKRFSLLFIFSVLLFASAPLFCEDNKWTIAAQKFTPDSGTPNNAVNDKTGELIPSDILEKIGNSVVRNVMPDEQFERTKYKLRTERQSLFLQLSAEYKRRDALVLSNYSELKLKSALTDSKKKIKEIQKKIDTNLQEEKKAYEKNAQRMQDVADGKAELENKDSELIRYRKLFKNIFVKDENLIQQEQIHFYKDDYTSLFALSDDVKEKDITDPLYEKKVVSAGINTLITGHFSKFDEYISVYVDVYEFPGAKKIGSVAEVGSVQDLELVTNSIAMQIVPMLSNSLPVELELTIGPEEAASGAKVYVDDELQKIENNKIIVDSGIHTIQFISDGYKNAGTTYSFEGNRKYKIEVTFEKPKLGYLQLGLRKPVEGESLMNGERSLEITNVKSQIAINGKEILGEFIAENGETAFFYIPKNLVFDGSYVTINPKPMDRMAYVDKRRKIMYASYSAFMVSLIPTFYTYGNYKNNVNLYRNYQVDYDTAKSWQTATNITRIISIGCGIFWGYELVRYLIAANSVLPQNARAGDLAEFEYYEPPIIDAEAAASTENSETTETETDLVQGEK